MAFPQFNGRAEVAVKAAKRLLMSNTSQNGELDNDNLLRAMLQLRNTPDPDCHVSPAEIVFGRNIRDAFSFINRIERFSNKNIHPRWHEAWKAKELALKHRFTRSMERLEEHTRPLQPLAIGDRVFVQNQIGHSPKKWDRTGMVVDTQANDQYLIKIDGSGRLTLRNRRFLRLFKQFSTEIIPPQLPPVMPASSLPDTTPAPEAHPVLPTSTTPAPGAHSGLPTSTTQTPQTAHESSLPDTHNEEEQSNNSLPDQVEIDCPNTDQTEANVRVPTDTCPTARPRWAAKPPKRYVPETGQWS